MVIHFPRCPAPEVHIQIAQVLAVLSDAPFARWHPVYQGRRFLRVLISVFNPTAATLGLLFVRGITDHHSDWLISLNLVRIFAGLGKRGQYSWNPALVVVRVSQ